MAGDAKQFKFKIQPYQTHAVESVVDCFEGQPNSMGITYRIDPGRTAQAQAFDEGFKNPDLRLSEADILKNVQKVQRRQNLPLSQALDEFHTKNNKGANVAVPAATRKLLKAICPLHLDVEMETGTGKTYCYIKTMFEMSRRYGWSKFIVVVPSIAIREGVYESFRDTADHFSEGYGRKACFFIYNSKQLHDLESFSFNPGINVMIINIQAFNSTGKDNRRIYEELDDFQSRRPIDVISANRPILILDEPQKMEGKKTLESLARFKPLMVLRYSATHRTTHNLVHRLDALDAYNQKLVKKIAVRGITVKGLTGTNAYLYLESIEISKQAPLARIELEVRRGDGIKRVVRRLGKGRDLYVESKGLEQYRGFVISDIRPLEDKVEFSNGTVLVAGDATGDVTEDTKRRIQIREAIKAHLEKERRLFAQGIKTLSLFFIDEVAKYRDYKQEDEKGEYARIFEETYEKLRNEVLAELPLGNESYRKYLADVPIERIHNGYFSIDKKSKKLVDPTVKKRGEEAGLSDDVDAYDLILKDKKRLLSMEEPVRFIFSHSALREGWDNPNIFVMGMLKHSDNTISRRQEVGRGLRISVNKDFERTDNPATVHDINVLTVVASESYQDFVTNLQKEMSEALSARPRKANAEYFAGKLIETDDGPVEISADQAESIEFYLIQNAYVDKKRQIADAYHEAKAEGTLAELPEDLAPFSGQIFELIDSVFSMAKLPDIGDDRKPKRNPLNKNFDKKEFQELWNRINKKAIYRVEFDSEELIGKCIATLNRELRVRPLQYTVESGIQTAEGNYKDWKSGDGFEIHEPSTTKPYRASVRSAVKYDLLGKLAEEAKLTRKTISSILTQIEANVFAQFQQNPEHFLAEAARLINEQKATMIIDKLSYDEINESFESKIFTAGQDRQDFSSAVGILDKHIYNYAVTDSKGERKFVKELDVSGEVVVYAKLPNGFKIPTPVGDYNPDWAIAFKEGAVKHVYFVAETKGSMSSMQLRAIEEAKIECARKFFDEINRRLDPEHVKYDVVTDYGKLMEIVGARG